MHAAIVSIRDFFQKRQLLKLKVNILSKYNLNTFLRKSLYLNLHKCIYLEGRKKNSNIVKN